MAQVLLYLLGAVILVHSAVAEDSGAFDCNRPGQSCFDKNDICYRNETACECVEDPPRQGVTCAIVTSQINGTGCDSIDCVNGVCVSNAGGASCLCPPDYYGEFCDIPYVSVECSVEYMTVYVKPYGDFNGHFFINGTDDAACEAVAIPDPRPDYIDDKYQGYYLRINYTDSPCGNVDPLEGDDITTRDVLMALQYMSQIITGRDQRFLVRCFFNRNNHVIQSQGLVVDKDTSQLSKNEIENTANPIGVRVTVGGVAIDPESPPQLIIETRVCVEAYVAKDQGAIEINTVLFNSSNDGDLYEWEIFNAGCEDSQAPLIDFKAPWYPDGKDTAKFCFDMFFVKPSGRVNVWVTVSTCLDPDDCGTDTCGGRRKRQAKTVEKRSQDLELVFFVKPQGETQPSGETQPPVVGEIACDGITCRSYFLPVVCGLAGLAVLTLAVVVFFIVLNRRRRPRLQEKSDVPYSTTY